MKIQHIFIFLTFFFYEKKMLHDSAYFAHATERESYRVIQQHIKGTVGKQRYKKQTVTPYMG